MELCFGHLPSKHRTTSPMAHLHTIRHFLIENKYGQSKSLSLVAISLFGTNRSIFLVDVLGSSTKITKKLDFQPFRIESSQWTHTKLRLDIFGVVINLVKIQFIFANNKILEKLLYCILLNTTINIFWISRILNFQIFDDYFVVAYK
jgi:hypothetical protein